jgi:uncharacterized protein YbaA (DUF1428 family)
LWIACGSATFNEVIVVRGVDEHSQQYPDSCETTYMTSPTTRESLTSPGMSNDAMRLMFAGFATSSASTRLLLTHW